MVMAAGHTASKGSMSRHPEDSQCHAYFRTREITARMRERLSSSEQELILEASDALLFGEPEGEEKLDHVFALRHALVTEARISRDEATEILDALLGCAALNLTSQ
jgi:hypothetical protein